MKKSRLLLFSVSALLLISSSVSDVPEDDFYIYSPNGKSAFVDEDSQYPTRFDCFFFAWHNNNGYGRHPGTGWMQSAPSKFGYLEMEVISKWTDDGSDSTPSGYPSYVSCSQSVGEIVVYEDESGPRHAARMINDEEVIHKPNNVDPIATCDIDETGYGEPDNFYRVNPNYRPVGDGSGRYSSANDALNNAPSGSIVSLFSAGSPYAPTYNIPSGVTLYVQNGVTVNFGSDFTISGEIEARSGSTINFNSGCDVTINGTIDVKDGASLNFNSGSTITKGANGDIDFDDVSDISIADSVYSISVTVEGDEELYVNDEGEWEATGVSGGFPPYSYVWLWNLTGPGPNWSYGVPNYESTYAHVMDAEYPPNFYTKVEVTDKLADIMGDDYITVLVAEAQKISGKIPTTFKLSQNYPNPFNPVTTIRYQLPKPADVTLVIYDIAGKEVARLVEGPRGPGYHAEEWNASDTASGVYICKLTAGDFTDIKRMILVK
ncbi:T9SS type A sorting domain-containing protein [candidate division KSB1 bacterium]